jgi:hypothetical protein
METIMTRQDDPRPADELQDELLAVETSVEQATGVRGPVNWWQSGLIVLSILAALLLIMQIMAGGASTDVVPGTPVVEGQPQTQ